jgi:hypothetical protein
MKSTHHEAPHRMILTLLPEGVNLQLDETQVKALPSYPTPNYNVKG